MTPEYKELLTLAAKALDVELFEHKSGELCLDKRCKDLWRPHEYDSHAFRLKIDLKIDLLITPFFVVASRNEIACMELAVDHPDRYSSSRKAIVRVAAEIGRKLNG